MFPWMGPYEFVLLQTYSLRLRCKSEPPCVARGCDIAPYGAEEDKRPPGRRPERTKPRATPGAVILRPMGLKKIKDHQAVGLKEQSPGQRPGEIIIKKQQQAVSLQ